MVDQNILPKSLLNSLKDGSITPEEAIKDAFPSAFTRISDISVESLRVESLSTGFSTLDKHFALKKGRPELVVVGAGTSHGKSAFLCQIAANVAREGNVFVFSLEMDERDIKARLLAPRINVSLSKIMAGQVSSQKLREFDVEFRSLPLFVCANGRRDVSYIRSSCHEMSKKATPILIIVDYLQLVKSVDRNTRTAEIADILGHLKSLAKEMKCPVMIGSQLNRECERRGKSIQMSKGIGDYIPIKSDLMDSSHIEHDADVIMFLSRQFVYDRTRPNEADFIIAKNRNGKTCKEVFSFSGEMCSFYDIEKDQGL